MRLKGQHLPAVFLSELRKHLSEGKGLADCAASAGLHSHTFSAYIREAFSQGYLKLRQSTSNDAELVLADFIKDVLKGKASDVVVADGDPDSQMFAALGAEQLLEKLKLLLMRKETITLLIISGSSTGELIHEMVTSDLWHQRISPEISKKKCTINVVAGNITPVKGQELYGNAVASVVLFSRYIASKMPNSTIIPHGLVASLIVNENERFETDTKINKEVIKIVDNGRLLKGYSDEDPNDVQTEVDIILSGIGSYVSSKSGPKKLDNSVYQWVVDTEHLTVPTDLVGDIGFYGIDSHGKPLPLERAGGEKVFIYSISGPRLMRTVAKNKGYVLLVAASKRRYGGVSVSKGKAVAAAFKGGLANVLITDLDTAKEILAENEEEAREIATQRKIHESVKNELGL